MFGNQMSAIADRKLSLVIAFILGQACDLHSFRQLGEAQRLFFSLLGLGCLFSAQNNLHARVARLGASLPLALPPPRKQVYSLFDIQIM